jgi:hypothetical protein
VPDGKGAKAAQFHPVSMGKRRCYSIEDRGHDGFDVAITPSRHHANADVRPQSLR